jgi:hypothetical protein
MQQETNEGDDQAVLDGTERKIRADASRWPKCVAFGKPLAATRAWHFRCTQDGR